MTNTAKLIISMLLGSIIGVGVPEYLIRSYRRKVLTEALCYPYQVFIDAPDRGGVVCQGPNGQLLYQEVKQ